MIKGGFQGLDISGVDLTAQSPTLPGGYTVCQAADGKTVLVLTAAGAVQCSVKKVSTNYVLAGITGDGKILSITIGSTDGISVSETTPAAETSGNVKIGSSTTISNATTADPFVVPQDGYIRVHISSTASASASSYISARIAPTTGGYETIAKVIGPPAEGQSFNESYAFVKKGSIVDIDRYPGFTGGSAYYRPLVAV